MADNTPDPMPYTGKPSDVENISLGLTVVMEMLGPVYEAADGIRAELRRHEYPDWIVDNLAAAFISGWMQSLMPGRQ